MFFFPRVDTCFWDHHTIRTLVALNWTIRENVNFHFTHPLLLFAFFERKFMKKTKIIGGGLSLNEIKKMKFHFNEKTSIQFFKIYS
jgi:hypothetical protein